MSKAMTWKRLSTFIPKEKSHIYVITNDCNHVLTKTILPNVYECKKCFETFYHLKSKKNRFDKAKERALNKLQTKMDKNYKKKLPSLQRRKHD